MPQITIMKYIDSKVIRASTTFSISLPKLQISIDFLHRIETSLVVESIYSSALTENHQTYARTGYNEAGYYYEAIEVNVVEAGVYNFGSNSSVTQFGFIYNGSFNRFRPHQNLIVADDKSCDQQFKLRIYLQVNTAYVLVVTTFSPNVTGEFSIIVSGPNNVSFNHISEYLHYFVNNQHKNTEYRICL